MNNPHLINLPVGTFTLTIPGRDETAGAAGDLNVTAGAIRIVGQRATQTIVQGRAAEGTASTGCGEWRRPARRSSRR